MALNYVNLASTAERLIDENGRTCTIQPPATPIDPTRAWAGSAVDPADILTVTAVFLQYLTTEIDGDLIRRADQRVLIAANAVAGALIERYATLVDDGVTWAIVAVTAVVPGDTAIYYDCQVRK